MADHRPPLLLLHPAATLSGVWRPLARTWQARWRILALDLIPDGDPVTQLRRWAEQAAALITTAGGDPAHVVSTSLGASVALRLALDHPGLVASLTLDSAQLGGPPPAPGLRWLGRFASLVVRRLPARLLAAALLTQFPVYRGEDRATVRAEIMRLGAPSIIGHLRAQLAHDVHAEAHRIAAPTLLLAGEHDPLTRPGAHVTLQRAIPSARMIVVPDAGHVTFLSHPEALRRELPAFLDNLPE
jgi:3-oxoadipate enol-lactonase